MNVRRESRWTQESPSEFIEVWQRDDQVTQALSHLVEKCAEQLFAGDYAKASSFLVWCLEESAKDSRATLLELGEWGDFPELNKQDEHGTLLELREDAEERARQLLLAMGYEVED